MRTPGGGPHAGQPVLTAGPAFGAARAAAILVHGRGASAGDILALATEIDLEDLAWLAPQAAAGSWYPLSFLAPIERNQPGLDSGLGVLEGLVGELAAAGIGAERLGLVGFSQGACLVAEFVARHPRRYGAVAALTGGLIGPPGHRRHDSGSLAGTPVFLGAGDPDPHVPWARVEETARVLERLGAAVELRRYPGLPHAVNADEIDAVRRRLTALGSSGGV